MKEPSCSLTTPRAPRDKRSDRHRSPRRCSAFRCYRHRIGRPAAPSSTAVHGRRIVAHHVRRLVRHVELPIHPPRREQLFHDPHGPTQGSDPGSGPDLSRRQSTSQGRPSAHQATRGRFPDPLSIAHAVSQLKPVMTFRGGWSPSLRRFPSRSVLIYSFSFTFPLAFYFLHRQALLRPWLAVQSDPGRRRVTTESSPSGGWPTSSASPRC